MAGQLDLTYGASGSGKTTWYLALAEYNYVKNGKKTRWYLGDGGGETIRNSGLIEEGAVELWQFSDRDNPFATLQLACEGYWPENPHDPKCKLKQPSMDEFYDYGMFVYEGLSVGSDYMMGSKNGGLSDRAARGEKIGQDTPYVVLEEGLKFGGNPPSHFGFVQRRIVDLVERSRSIPVPFVGWTAHERKAEDSDLKGVYTFGPDVCGQALTSKIGAYFGNTIHMVAIPQRTKSKDPITGKEIETIKLIHRAYTRKHSDPEGNTNVKFYANNRIPKEFADKMPEFLYPADPMKFYEILEDAKEAKREMLQKKKG
jgi:hypothetical protein